MSEKVEEYLFTANLAEQTGRYKGYIIIVYVRTYIYISPYFCQYAFRFHPLNSFALPQGYGKTEV